MSAIASNSGVGRRGLRIRFADFPYPRSFHGLEAIHLGDLLRILVRAEHVALLSIPHFSRFGQERTRCPE